MAELWFNGKSSTDAGIRHVEKYPALNRPERQARIVDVPGRNGDVVQLLDAWNDYEQDYEIYGGDGTKGSAPVAFNSIYAWLNSATGYARLEDIYEPDYFRLAYFTGPMDVDNVFSQFGRATITFMCRPERFLKSGADKGNASNPSVVCGGMNPSITNGGGLRNPTGYTSHPLIRVPKTSGTATVTITAESGNTYTMTVDGANAPTGGIVIDCETGNAFGFSDNTVDCNGIVAFSGGIVPALEPGENTFTVSPSAGTSLYVAPRWFEI